MTKHKDNIGGVIRGLLNGVKHTPETIAPLIGVEQKTLEAVIEGQAPLTAEIEQAIVSITGINQRDLYPAEATDQFPIIDDTNQGVVICRAAATAKSERTLSRGPANVPYYIYADTAMSNVSTFRPEWIKELYVHDGTNTDLPDWAFNKGHFEHQMTYFIGPVNFYWIDKDGQKHVEQMNSGDTNYIVPFVPHTFTTRKEGEGLILAVTYGGAIADSVFKGQITKLTVEDYLKEVTEKLAGVNFIKDEKVVDGVAILKHQDAGAELVSSSYQPDTRVRELVFAAAQNEITEMVDSDRWVYNVGTEAVTLAWNGQTAEFHPNDSLFIKPGTSHTFKKTGNGDQVKLLVVDIKPAAGDPYQELKVIEHYAGAKGLARVHTETTRWY